MVREMRVRILGLILGSLLACTGAQSEVRTSRPVATAAQADRVPSCSPTAAEALEATLGDVDDGIRALRDGDDPAPLLKRLGEAWSHPCLSHVARFFSPPRVKTASALKEWRATGVMSALLQSVGGLGDERQFWILPQARPALDSEKAAALAPSLCPGDAKACSVAGSYILRAEQASRPAPSASDEQDCAQAQEAWEGPVERRPTPFEAWALCEIDRAERRELFPEGNFKAPEQGWLLLRGRRGHYRFTDEVRAYDLSTGAAYVAQSGSALALRSGGTVDFEETDRARSMRTFTGRVSADQVRELAFILLFRQVPMLRRVTLQSLTVPSGVPFTLTALKDGDGFGAVAGGSMWGSTAQTRLAWTLFDHQGVKGTGTLTWPNAWNPMEDHADGLLRVLEAGLVEGCAPAPLPALPPAPPPNVSKRDADPGKLDETERELDHALEALRGQGCPTAGQR
jgi:hypothetical protein